MCDIDSRASPDWFDNGPLDVPLDALHNWLLEEEDVWDAALADVVNVQPQPSNNLEEKASTDSSAFTGISGAGSFSLQIPSHGSYGCDVKVRHKEQSKKPGTRDVHKRYRQRKKMKTTELQARAQELRNTYETLIKENAMLQERARTLDLLVKGCNAQVNLLTSLESRNAKVSDTLPDGAIKQFIRAAGIDRFDNLTTDHMANYWKLVIPHLSDLVMQAEASYEPALLRLLDVTCHDMLLFYRQVCVLNPEIVARSWAINVQTGQPGVPDISHWLNALAAVKLTEEQRRKFHLCQEMLTASLQRLSEERRDVFADFAKLSLTEVSCTSCCASGRDLADSALKRISSSLNKETNLQILVTMYFCGEVDTVQFMKFMVLSYPYFPDPNGIGCALMTLRQVSNQGRPVICS